MTSSFCGTFRTLPLCDVAAAKKRKVEARQLSRSLGATEVPTAMTLVVMKEPDPARRRGQH
jgi:hypothetical protein